MRSEKRTFALYIEVFADSDEELNELKQDIGSDVFSRADVVSVSIL